MKRLILATMILLGIGVASAVVGEDCPPGMMCITSGDPASTNASNSTNFSDARVDLAVVSKSCSSGGNDTIRWGDYRKMESYPPQHHIEFNGTIITPNPCQSLDHNVSSEGGIYTLNIYTKSENGICTQCLGAVKYHVEFNAQTEYFQLNVRHNGEDVKSFAPPQKINEGGLGPGPNEETKPVPAGFIASLLSFLSGLF